MNTVVKKRIDVIDALRGFALMGIIILHCMEHFELFLPVETSSPILQWFDSTLHNVVWFIFAGKSYAIFSLLFGLSFVIQMHNQEEKGKDFRLRFIWRLAILFALGYLNGLMYHGEIFAVYALLGLLLIPFYKVPDKWLIPIGLLLLFMVPHLLWFFAMLIDSSITAAPFAGIFMKANMAYANSNVVLGSGSFLDVISYNSYTGQMQKWGWMIGSGRCLQLLGLFITGMVIARRGIHKDEDKMVHYSKRLVLYGVGLYIVATCINNILPHLGIESAPALRLGRQVFGLHVDLGLMCTWIGLFVLAYFKLGAKKVLNYLAPYGRMSVTNYMLQSIIGAILFYGYGFGLAAHLGDTYSFLVGIAFAAVQITFSNWWLKRYYYGPMEWLWRGATWFDFKGIPFRRKAA